MAEIETTVRQVTVYVDGARISRGGKIALPHKDKHTIRYDFCKRSQALSSPFRVAFLSLI